MSDKEGEVARLFIDLVEALSALGNYLSALHHIAHSEAMQPPGQFTEVLERSIVQYERAADAARRVRNVPSFALRNPRLLRC